MVGDVATAAAGVWMACCLRVVRTDADVVCRSFVEERGPRVRVLLIVAGFGAVVVVGVVVAGIDRINVLLVVSATSSLS